MTADWVCVAWYANAIKCEIMERVHVIVSSHEGKGLAAADPEVRKRASRTHSLAKANQVGSRQVSELTWPE